MKKMKMPRDFMLRSTTGHMVKFEANVVRDVPPACIEEAITVGAVFADGSAFIPREERPKGEEPKYGFEREEDIYRVCMAISNPDSFTASGIPKLDVVCKELGYGVDRKEINKVWRKIQEARANAA